MIKRNAVALGLAVLVLAGRPTLEADRAHAQATGQGPAAPKTAAKIPAALPPDVAFGHFIALIRGHLLTGDELVKERNWRDAHPHFNFPLEEVYGVIREDLRTYKTPPFEDALKALAGAVQARKIKQYRKAREKVENALKAADAGLKARQPNWARFEVAVAIETLKTAAEEHEDAFAKGRLVHPIGYETAQGFILQADRMIESVAGELGPGNAEALREMRAGLSELKRLFAGVDAPKRPPIADAALRGVISRIARAAGTLTRAGGADGFGGSSVLPNPVPCRLA